MSYGILQAARSLLAGLLGLPLYEVDDSRDYPVDGDGAATPYLMLRSIEAPSAPFALRHGGTVVRRGFVQVDVLLPQSIKTDAAEEVVRQVVRAFPRGTRLGLAEVERPAYPASPLDQTPYNQVPVTVPWVARIREEES